MPNKNILVTGGAGFIGSNFISLYLDNHPNDAIVNLDKLTYAGRLENLREVTGHPRYTFIKGDICDGELLERIFKEYDITDCIHFAAESHVDQAIREPEPFMMTNIQGTYQLLKTCLNHWRSDLMGHRFHHISTDEVFGTLEPEEQPFTENSPYRPNNPYSASKASAAMLVRSFTKTYGLNSVITHCSNNYGPKQHGEKFIPMIISRALSIKEIPIYGDGKQIRDWLFVRDHCEAVDLVFHKGKIGEEYNIGGRNEVENGELAEMICDMLDVFCPLPIQTGKIRHYRDLIKHVEDRPAHDRRYAINPSKLERDLGFKPKTVLKDGLRETIQWVANVTLKSMDTEENAG
ncbi:MAG: dTDP-glucose 4,6-dehydratase [Tuberibacillus sp.]